MNSIWATVYHKIKTIFDDLDVESNVTLFENTFISRSFLGDLWSYHFSKSDLLFTSSNVQESRDLQQNTAYSAQCTYLEWHTSYPYENSDRCNPAEGTVPVKVFTVRNFSNNRRSDIFRGYIGKNFQGCPIKVTQGLCPYMNEPITVS